MKTQSKYLQNKRKREREAKPNTPIIKINSFDYTLIERKQQANALYKRALRIKDTSKKIQCLEKAMGLDNTNQNINYNYLSLIQTKRTTQQLLKVNQLLLTLPEAKISKLTKNKNKTN